MLFIWQERSSRNGCRRNWKCLKLIQHNFFAKPDTPVKKLCGSDIRWLCYWGSNFQITPNTKHRRRCNILVKLGEEVGPGMCACRIIVGGHGSFVCTPSCLPSFPITARRCTAHVAGQELQGDKVRTAAHLGGVTPLDPGCSRHRPAMGLFGLVELCTQCYC